MLIDCILAIDLIGKLIELDPSMRLTAEQTLLHPYLREYHDPSDEPACTTPLTFDRYPVAYSNNDLEISKWKGTNSVTYRVAYTAFACK